MSDNNSRPLPLVTPTPPSTVELRADGVVFNVLSPDGTSLQSHKLTLERLVESGDDTALLVFGIMMQLTGLRQLVEDRGPR